MLPAPWWAALRQRSWRGTAVAKVLLFVLAIQWLLLAEFFLRGFSRSSLEGIARALAEHAVSGVARPPGPFRVAIFEHDAKHTEIMGVFLSWAKARSAQVTLFVGDDTYRSFVPLYRLVFGAAVGGPLVDVLPPSKLVEAFESFDVAIFVTAAPDKDRPFPAEVLKLQQLQPDRCVYVVHHVEKFEMAPRWWQRRLISLTPLLASPFLTPGFLDADDRWEDGPPRLRLSQRHRALCMIGTGANDRYESEDIAAFFGRQEKKVAAATVGGRSTPTAGAQLVRRTARHSAALGFQHGAAAALEGTLGQAAASSPSPMLLRLGGVDWDPATLTWWWPEDGVDTGDNEAGGHAARGPRVVRQLRLGSSFFHAWQVQALAARSGAAVRVPLNSSSAPAAPGRGKPRERHPGDGGGAAAAAVHVLHERPVQ
jgi:hypothetical protein